MRVAIGILLALFMLPLFAGIGMVGGCFVMLVLSSGGNSTLNSDAMAFTVMGLPALLGAALAIVLAALIARGLRFGN
ncbi:hypothetical protein IT575_15085 [bacterium]|nr:hypothetical protein [bacterium]